MTDGRGRKFAFVNYETSEMAQAAVEDLHKKDMRTDEQKAEAAEKEEEEAPDGHPDYLLYVQRAMSKAERQAEFREKSTGGQGGGGGQYSAPGRTHGVNLYVKNLDETTDDTSLRELFKPFGTVTSVAAMKDEKSRCKGFGFVCFASPDEATKAVTEMHLKVVKGKPLYVGLAEKREARQERLRQRYSPSATGMPGKGGKGSGGKGGMPGMPPQMYGPQSGMPPMMYGNMPGMRPPQAGMMYPPMAQMMGPRAMMGACGPMMGGMGGQQMMGMMGKGGNQAANPQQMMGMMGKGPCAGPQMMGMMGKGPMPTGGMPMGGMMRPMMPQMQGGQPGGMARPQQPQGQQPQQPAASAPSPGGPLTAAALAAAPPSVQKQMLGEKLFPAIAKYQPEMAGKITGMMLEMDNSELLILLESEQQLKNKVEEALRVLEQEKPRGS